MPFHALRVVVPIICSSAKVFGFTNLYIKNISQYSENISAKFDIWSPTWREYAKDIVVFSQHFSCQLEGKITGKMGQFHTKYRLNLKGTVSRF